MDIDKTLGRLAIIIAYMVLGLTVIFLVGSMLPRNGSLDDLDAETIKRVVDGETR